MPTKKTPVKAASKKPTAAAEPVKAVKPGKPAGFAGILRTGSKPHPPPPKIMRSRGANRGR